MSNAPIRRTLWPTPACGYPIPARSGILFFFYVIAKHKLTIYWYVAHAGKTESVAVHSPLFVLLRKRIL